MYNLHVKVKRFPSDSQVGARHSPFDVDFILFQPTPSPQKGFNLVLAYTTVLGLQPRDKAAMLGVKTMQFFSRRIYMKIEFSSQRREMLYLFLTTNMAAVTSRASQQFLRINFRFLNFNASRTYMYDQTEAMTETKAVLEY